MYGRVYPFALTWEDDCVEGYCSVSEIMKYIIPTFMVRPLDYQPSILIIVPDCFSE